MDTYRYGADDTLEEGDIEVGRVFDEGDFNRIVEIREREQARVNTFMGLINQTEKTLVFCANQAHALVIRDIINQTKNSTDPNYCHRVTANDGELGEQYLREFQDNEKTIPTILTTSQKLSTGIDARDIRNIVLLRPIRSMIEFKQIIGRGTRLFEGKNYFTVYDFVGAHQHFLDPEWDGEPIEPEPRPPGGGAPPPTPEPLPPDGGDEGGEPVRKARIKLADGKARTIQHFVITSFWHPNGTPLTAQEFVEELYGRLPEYFSSLEDLQVIWSDPITRKQLLSGLSEKGFGSEQLSEIRRIVDAEDSDVFDALAHIAFAYEPVSRDQRAMMAREHVAENYDVKKRAFIDFVLFQYVNVGVEELDLDNLTPLLKLKYKDSIPDALSDLGKPDDVRTAFVEFQKWLYGIGSSVR